MNMKVEISAARCVRIAQSIGKSSFWMAGNGHFSLTDEEVAEILFICINSSRYKEMGKTLAAKHKLWLRQRGM